MRILDYLFYISEILAAIAGLISLKYLKVKALRYFVLFLCITVLVETFGMLSMHFSEWSFLEQYKESMFISENYWLYNVYHIFNYVVYTFFFRSYLTNKMMKLFLMYAVMIFFFSSIINLILSNVYFVSYSAYTVIFGALLILLSVFFYFYEMLTSYKVLRFYENIAFYIAIGSIVFHLCTTPLFIFSRYFKEENNDFVDVYYLIQSIAIIFMYTCYTIGFSVCLKKNKSYL